MIAITYMMETIPGLMIGVIHNPNSGKKDHEGKMKSFLSLLTKEGIEYDYRETQGPGDACTLAAELADHCDTIVVASGDGTLFEAINSIWEKDISLAILPYGTGNDLYKGIYGADFSEEKIVSIIKNGNRRKIDCARVNDTYTMTLIGAFGFPADMVIKHKETGCSYGRTIPGLLTHINRRNYTLKIDGKEIDYETEFIGVFCTGSAGGGMCVTKLSSMTDGVMEVVVIKKSSVIRRLLNLLAIIRGRLDFQPNVDKFQFTECTIIPEKTVTCNLDGEVIDFDVFDVKVLKQKLEFLVE